MQEGSNRKEKQASNHVLIGKHKTYSTMPTINRDINWRLKKLIVLQP